MMASVGSSMVGSGTVSTRTSWVPCQVSAFTPRALPGLASRHPMARVRAGDAHRLLPLERRARPEADGGPRDPRRAGGVLGSLDLRPLPPVERRAGPQPVRLVRDRRD